jgi:Family of unknown function (DUF6448)
MLFRLLRRNHSAILLIGFSLLLIPIMASAHCDTLDGPVVIDARTALSSGDVTLVLKWVNAEDEQIIRDTFAKTLTVREINGEVQEIADRSFFETLVRIHRASEGEPYTGLKPAGSVDDKVVLMADETIVSGSVDGFATKIASHTEEALRERYDKLMLLAETKDQTPEAGREWVEAYVDYIHFAKAVAAVVHGHSAHHGGGESHAGH